MKLRKALEKAKSNRSNAGVLDMTSRQRTSETSSSNWTPPSYTTSRISSVDLAAAISNRCVSLAPFAKEAEHYKVLRAKLQQKVLQQGKRTVLVTSPTPGDGKTLTVTNLAVTFAKAYNQTVLLADCDLKRQNVHNLFGIESELGIQNYLVDGVPLEKIIIWPGIEQLCFISGGPLTENSAEVLSSPRMKTLLAELKSRYDDRIVLLDAPPILSGADTLALAPIVDSIVLVVAEGKTPMKSVQQSIELLPPEKLIGIVLNREKYPSTNAYYY